MKLIFTLVILASSFTAHADCKSQLIAVVATAEQLIENSNLDPRCKALGLIGGKQNCIQATEGTIWDLKKLIEPVLASARSLCQQNVCSANKKTCLDLLKNETHLVRVGVYGLIQDIQNANW